MKIGLAYALEGEIESILRTTDAKQLETVCGVAVYEIAPDVLAYVGGVGKVNAAMSAQLFIDRYHPDWIISAGVAGCFRDLPIGTMVLTALSSTMWTPPPPGTPLDSCPLWTGWSSPPAM